MSLKDLIKWISTGLLLSIILISFKWTIPFTWTILWLVPISFLCAIVDRKWTCLSYVVPVTYLFGQIEGYIGGTIKYFDLPYSKFIVIIGLLHMIEGIIAWVEGPKNVTATVGYTRKGLVKGYQTYTRWFIPFFVFEFEKYLIPFLIIMVYKDDTTSLKPEKNFERMGLFIGIYGIIVFTLGVFINYNKFSVVLGLILMPILHEILFIIDKIINFENKIKKD